VICPHPDDEIAWCYSQLNERTTVILLSKSRRSTASRKLANVIGYNLLEYDFPDLHFSSRYDEVLKCIEGIITDGDFERLVYTAPSQHQDHKVVNDIMHIITRPLANKIVEVYEYPYLTYEYTEYNAIFKVTDQKFKELEAFDMGSSWEKYIRNYNAYIASRHNRDGYYEPFKLIFKEWNTLPSAISIAR